MEIEKKNGYVRRELFDERTTNISDEIQDLKKDIYEIKSNHLVHINKEISKLKEHVTSKFDKLGIKLIGIIVSIVFLLIAVLLDIIIRYGVKI